MIPVRINYFYQYHSFIREIILLTISGFNVLLQYSPPRIHKYILQVPTNICFALARVRVRPSHHRINCCFQTIFQRYFVSFWWFKVSVENIIIIIIITPVRYCTGGSAATRSPAGHPYSPHDASCTPYTTTVVAFFKVFSSGLETKERIGTECQRPTVLGRNFYCFFHVKRSKFLSAYVLAIHIHSCISYTYLIYINILNTMNNICIKNTYMLYPPGFFITGINKSLIINQELG